MEIVKEIKLTRETEVNSAGTIYRRVQTPDSIKWYITDGEYLGLITDAASFYMMERRFLTIDRGEPEMEGWGVSNKDYFKWQKKIWGYNLPCLHFQDSLIFLNHQSNCHATLKSELIHVPVLKSGMWEEENGYPLYETVDAPDAELLNAVNASWWKNEYITDTYTLTDFPGI